MASACFVLCAAVTLTSELNAPRTVKQAASLQRHTHTLSLLRLFSQFLAQQALRPREAQGMHISLQDSSMSLMKRVPLLKRVRLARLVLLLVRCLPSIGQARDQHHSTSQAESPSQMAVPARN